MRGFADLPSVHSVISAAEAEPLITLFGRRALVESVRAALDQRRGALASGLSAGACDEASILLIAESKLEERARGSLRRVLNLTGTVLHTNLGRAPLPQEALKAMAEAAGACNLEWDVESGRRGHRDSHAEASLLELTGAEAASVVNNNAAAVMLLVNALANRKDVLVSRGELVEIGGGFRIPEVITRAGARLREVGATNRTHISDYARALTPRTGAILKVHRSNFELRGFTSDPDEAELAALARANEIPFIVDLGSGALVDLARFGLPSEPTPMASLRCGADAVCFSGDKLLGGPQAGVIVGRTGILNRVRRNPLMRAVRCDKLSIAALGAVLELYRDPERVAQRVPAIKLLARTQKEIMPMARALHARLESACEGFAHVEVVECASQIGSGAQPTHELQSAGLKLTPAAGAKMTAGKLAAMLRALPRPVAGRIQARSVVLDLRCLEDPAELADQMDLLRERLAKR